MMSVIGSGLRCGGEHFYRPVAYSEGPGERHGVIMEVKDGVHEPIGPDGILTQ